MEERWLSFLGKMTYGIYVLTTSHGPVVNGMIASWVSQVSYDPPKVMAAIHQNRLSHELIRQSGCFALHLLRRNQKDLLTRFKLPDPVEKFESIPWKKGRYGCPILMDCLGYLECVVTEKYSPGNHTLFIGEIMDGQILSDDEAMNTLDYSGFYRGKD
jgi:flavin reductase (DIM6/NTAB) family NADH-FMN oxidoreductase RutF